jgi:predicted DNA-binding transcriptional regulator YafY
MKQYLIFGVFLELTRKRKTTAREIAERFETSTRTIYRYVDALGCAGIPIITTQGKNGGISISDNLNLITYISLATRKNIIKQSL